MLDIDVEVTNRSNGSVVYRIPERNLRREFHPHETKTLSSKEIAEVVAQPGGRELLYHYLLIQNQEVLRDILNVQEQPEYWLTEEKIAGGWLNSCTLDEFKDALDFAPEGVIDLIKKYAVSLPLNDVLKRQAILDQLNFNVNVAIENSKEEVAAATQDTTQRRTSPAYKPALQRRTEVAGE